YAAMMNGANVLMPDRFLQPDHLLRLMESQRPTYGAAVPTIWSGVLAQLEGTGQDISYLKTVIVGGAALSPAMMHAFEEKHGVRLLHAWGMTEPSPLGSAPPPPPGPRVTRDGDTGTPKAGSQQGYRRVSSATTARSSRTTG